jgi:hypothetical protein
MTLTNRHEGSKSASHPTVVVVVVGGRFALRQFAASRSPASRRPATISPAPSSKQCRTKAACQHDNRFAHVRRDASTYAVSFAIRATLEMQHHEGARRDPTPPTRPCSAPHFHARSDTGLAQGDHTSAIGRHELQIMSQQHLSSRPEAGPGSAGQDWRRACAAGMEGQYSD